MEEVPPRRSRQHRMVLRRMGDSPLRRAALRLAVAVRDSHDGYRCMRKPNYLRMFTTTALAAWILLLAYVGWLIAQSWPPFAFGPLWAESRLLLHVNVLLASCLIGLTRVGVVALIRGELLPGVERQDVDVVD
jgi:hypothetical protein